MCGSPYITVNKFNDELMQTLLMKMIVSIFTSVIFTITSIFKILGQLNQLVLMSLKLLSLKINGR